MYIRVHVHPGSRKETLTKETDDQWLLTVREPAEHNAANRRVRERVAEELGVLLAQVRILTGHQGRTKMMSVSNYP